jgi:hypothetical protein
MRQIASSDHHLTWVHPTPQTREFELRAGDDAVGTLAWESGTGSRAVAGTSEGNFSLKRLGFLHPHVTVRHAGEDLNVARFDPNLAGGGVVHFAEGRQYRWATNFWLSQWSWVDSAGNHVVSFKRHFSQDKREGDVELRSAGGEIPHAALLVILGWYLIILMAEDHAAAIVP